MPTWQYGHEPFSPFANKIAKYLQNSIREDGLLAVATHGIIYVQGGAGTLQEVFQDAAQNAYHSFPGKKGAGYFSPMVFFGEFWEGDRPVKPLLDKVVSSPPCIKDEYEHLVIFTKEIDKAVESLSNFKPPGPNKTIASLTAGRTLSL